MIDQTIVVEGYSFCEGSEDYPGGTENLERRQTKAVGLVLDENMAQMEVGCC